MIPWGAKPAVVSRDDEKWSISPLSNANNGAQYKMTHAYLRIDAAVVLLMDLRYP